MSVFSALPLFALIREKFYTTPSPALGDTGTITGKQREKGLLNFSCYILPYCNADISCFISSDKKLPYLAVCNVNITRAGLKFGRRRVILNLVLGKNFFFSYYLLLWYFLVYCNDFSISILKAKCWFYFCKIEAKVSDNFIERKL